MRARSQSIFRPDALRRYQVDQEKPVLPRFTQPRVTGWLWVWLSLLGVGMVTVWIFLEELLKRTAHGKL